VGWECFLRGEDGMVETKVDEWLAKACKSKKEKKKNKARSHLKASRPEETLKAEEVDPPELEFAEPALCEEATPCEEAAPCEDTTPYEEPTPCEEPALCEQAAPYEEVTSCEEATLCEEAPCEEAPCEEAPCEEAPCEEASCEEAPFKEAEPVNKVLTEELTAIIEGFMSEDDCSDG
jgi:hypothetical protein